MRLTRNWNRAQRDDQPLMEDGMQHMTEGEMLIPNESRIPSTNVNNISRNWEKQPMFTDRGRLISVFALSRVKHKASSLRNPSLLPLQSITASSHCFTYHQDGKHEKKAISYMIYPTQNAFEMELYGINEVIKSCFP